MNLLQKHAKDTDELFDELKKEKHLENYLTRNKNEFMISLDEYLNNLLAEKNLNKQEVVKKSGLSREYAYHIFAGNRKNPSRPKILAIGIAMDLNLKEMQYLLKYAKLPPLYPRSQWDSVIISAIEQKLNVIQTNELLHRLGENILLE